MTKQIATTPDYQMVRNAERNYSTHEVQIANGDWFPLFKEDGLTFVRTEKNNTYCPGLYSLSLNGLITGVRQIGDPREDIDLDRLEMKSAIDDITSNK